MSTSRLLLIDGLAVAYRAFHAIPPLSSRAGVPTNALFGFVKMLAGLERQVVPTHLAVVWDGGLPAERMELLPTYKANREPMPEALEAQLPWIDRYLGTRSIPAVRLDGVEADDALATIGQAAARDGARVWIATNDKDLFQLVSDILLLVSPSKGLETMSPAEVRAKTGVDPERIPDWLALVGDAADNIPGVPGIGPKTAAKLLAQFPSVGELVARVDEVESEKIRAAVREHAADLQRNLRMTTLHLDVPGVPDWEELGAWRGEGAETEELLRVLDLRSMLPRKEPEQPTLF